MSLPSTPLHTGNGPLLWCRLVLIPLYVIRVQDDYSQNNYGLTESRDGYITQGEYFVNLPDGRLQKVRILLSRADPWPLTVSGHLHRGRWCRLCGGRCLHRRASVSSGASWRIPGQKIKPALSCYLCFIPRNKCLLLLAVSLILIILIMIACQASLPSIAECQPPVPGDAAADWYNHHNHNHHHTTPHHTT